MNILTNIMLSVDRIANQRHVTAIRRAFLLTLPLIITGAFGSMLYQVTILWYQQLMAALFGSNWTVFWQAVTNVSLNGISFLLALSTSYFLAEQHELVKKGQVHPLVAAMISFICYMMIILPFVPENIPGILSFWTGVGGIFFAILIALTSTELFLRLFAACKINLELVTDVADTILHQALASVLPAIGTITIFALFKMAVDRANIQGLNADFYNQVGVLFLATQSFLGKIIVFILFVHIFWFFGLHGNKIMEPFLQYI